MPWPKTSRWTGCDTAEREGRVLLAKSEHLAKEQVSNSECGTGERVCTAQGWKAELPSGTKECQAAESKKS